jgi:hypothetical protein
MGQKEWNVADDSYGWGNHLSEDDLQASGSRLDGHAAIFQI